MKNNLLKVNLFLSIILLTVIGLPSFSQERSLKAINDTIDLYPGIPVTYDILDNDLIPVDDTIKNILGGGATHVQRQFKHDSTWAWTCTFIVTTWGFAGEVQGTYILLTMSMDTSSAKILFRIHDKSFSYLDINNVRARFTASGLHFFYENADYEVPKGSGKTSLFSNSLWIGGLDGQGKLHFAGERYRQGSGSSAGTKPDFYAGPVMDSTKYSIYQDTAWNYIWNLKKSEIDYHRAHYWEPGYTPVHDIATWPGNGDPALGQAHRLAPFSDRNGDGIYDPIDGDYPEIRGDQALFFIFNDDRGWHQESQGAKLRIEIHGMAYAFDRPNDTAFKNTVFLNYKIINRSQNIYTDNFFGVFSDIDLGYANDDYVGCDVMRGMYYGYNGTPVDGTGQSYAYGANPPVQGVVILAGPAMDSDGYDNPSYNGPTLLGPSFKGNCDIVALNGAIITMHYGPGEVYEESFLVRSEAVNGINFGDGIIDNERLGMNRFVYHGGWSVPPYMGDPTYAPEYYLFLQGIWKDNSKMIYGGNAHSTAGGYGPQCNFMFPGLTDICDWGTYGQPPAGPKEWTEITAQNNPQDRRGMASSGPISFKPGDEQELDIAFAWARDYDSPDPLGSLVKLNAVTDTLRRLFIEDRVPGSGQWHGIADHHKEHSSGLKIYPNPASGSLNIWFVKEIPPAGTTIEMMNSQGVCIKSMVLYDRRNPILLDVSEIPAGICFIRVPMKESLIVKKVVIMH